MLLAGSLKTIMEKDKYNSIKNLIKTNLKPQEYKKIDDLFIDCLVNKQSKKADNFSRVLEDMTTNGRIVKNGNSVKIIN